MQEFFIGQSVILNRYSTKKRFDSSSFLCLNCTRQQTQQCVRNFFTAIQQNREVPNNLKGKSKSSQDWIIRQLRDPYVEKAKIMNYRCRSAFKLIEIDDKFKILSPGQCVVDLGAAPGSWTQVLVVRTNSLGKCRNSLSGFVIGVDRLPIFPIDGATLINADFTSETAPNALREILKERKVDVVLSDMAPNASGVQSMDHENIINLVYSALRFSVLVSNVGGTFVAKIWNGAGEKELVNDVRRFYSNVREVKPKASRGNSSEKFILARGFRGLET